MGLRRLQSRCHDERGLAGVILTGVILWALVAVVMLTRTLVAAQQIDDKVVTIRHTVSPIDKDLDSVALAQETSRIAKDILAAAQPLSGQLDQVIGAATSIDAKAGSINATAGEINGTVKAIDGNARSINATVKDINATAKAINGNVKSIGANVDGIASSVNGIHVSLSKVLDTARIIRGEHGTVNGFGEGLAGINRRADAAIALVLGIKGDTANVLATVTSIQGSARSIDGKVRGPL